MELGATRAEAEEVADCESLSQRLRKHLEGLPEDDGPDWGGFLAQLGVVAARQDARGHYAEVRMKRSGPRRNRPSVRQSPVVPGSGYMTWSS